MPFKIYKQEARDKKRRKKRQGMQVNNRSIFVIVDTIIRKANKDKKKHK